MKPTEEEIRKLVSHQIDVLELMKYGINREVAMGYVAEVSRLIQSISIVAITETLDTEPEEIKGYIETDLEYAKRVQTHQTTKAQLCVNLWNEGNKDVEWLAKKVGTPLGYVKKSLRGARIDYSIRVNPLIKDGETVYGGAGSGYTDKDRLGFVIRIEELVQDGMPKFKALKKLGISNGCYNRWKNWVLSGRLAATDEQYAFITGKSWQESRKKGGYNTTNRKPRPSKRSLKTRAKRFNNWPEKTRKTIMEDWIARREEGMSVSELETHFTDKYGRPLSNGTVYGWFKKYGKKYGLSFKPIKEVREELKEDDSEPTPVEPEPVVTKPAVNVVVKPPQLPQEAKENRFQADSIPNAAIEISVLSRNTVGAMHNRVLLANAVFLKAKKKKGVTWREDIIASVATVKKVVDSYDKQLENEGFFVLAHRPDGVPALKQLKNNARVAKEIYRAMSY